MLQDSWRHHEDRAPRIHPKCMDTLLELHQAEILEDLNSLGRYSRLVRIMTMSRPTLPCSCLLLAENLLRE